MTSPLPVPSGLPDEPSVFTDGLVFIKLHVVVRFDGATGRYVGGSTSLDV